MRNSNKKNYLLNRYINFFITIFLSIPIFGNNTFSVNNINKGNSLSFILNNNISKDIQVYLGINKNKSITIDDIKASLIIIEVFNTYCTNCSQNIKQLNDVFLYINKNEKLNRQVKIIGIASGNNDNELKEYRKLHNLDFPIFTDYNFKIHKSLGNPRVPYTLFIEKKPNKQNKIFLTHQGNFKSTDEIIKIINSIIP